MVRTTKHTSVSRIENNTWELVRLLESNASGSWHQLAWGFVRICEAGLSIFPTKFGQRHRCVHKDVFAFKVYRGELMFQVISSQFGNPIFDRQSPQWEKGRLAMALFGLPADSIVYSLEKLLQRTVHCCKIENVCTELVYRPYNLFCLATSNRGYHIDEAVKSSLVEAYSTLWRYEPTSSDRFIR